MDFASMSFTTLPSGPRRNVRNEEYGTLFAKENGLNQVMTVTNYQGEARAYLEKLIEACGAKFTRNMTTANTHLIAARSLSSSSKI
jgi:hypothetical protein